MTREDGGGELRTALEDRLTTLLRRLGAMPSPTRDVRLLQVATWTQQQVESRRRGNEGYRYARWFQAVVAELLRETLPEAERPTVDWFDFSLHRLALSAANQRGALADARAESEAMERLIPRLAGHWERADLIMEGLVTQALHYIDSFHFHLAADRMRAVDAFYDRMSSLLSSALPGVFPPRVRSGVRVRALGTLMQAEMYLCLNAPDRLGDARTISDRAIDESPSPAERERQFRFRCQLETYAGQFAEGRRFLARNLGLADDAGHREIAGAIRPDESVRASFSLLHWLRLGTAAFLAGETAESGPFLSALSESRLLLSPWVVENGPMDYPAHGIRRQTAVLLAAQGYKGDALSTLGKLARLGHLESGHMGGALVHLAAAMEVAGLLWDEDAAKARLLLDSEEESRPGVRQILDRLSHRFPREYEIVRHVVGSWPAEIGRVLEDGRAAGAARRELLALARPIPR
jgi:hypothetical protein